MVVNGKHNRAHRKNGCLSHHKTHMRGCCCLMLPTALCRALRGLQFGFPRAQGTPRFRSVSLATASTEDRRALAPWGEVTVVRAKQLQPRQVHHPPSF